MSKGAGWKTLAVSGAPVMPERMPNGAAAINHTQTFRVLNGAPGARKGRAQ